MLAQGPRPRPQSENTGPESESSKIAGGLESEDKYSANKIFTSARDSDPGLGRGDAGKGEGDGKGGCREEAGGKGGVREDGGGEECGEGACGQRWDAVIDFVCFRKKGMEDIIAQAHMIEHYIFISTDSVFMACDREKVMAHQEDRGLPEEAAYPAATKLAKRVAKDNNEYQYEYGSGKLDCELLLSAAMVGKGGREGVGGHKGRKKGGFSRFTVLRLPDVIGPWDNLGGQLRLIQDLLAGQTVGTKVGAPCGRISIIGACDVARAILAVLMTGERVYGTTLHIACTEKPTFSEYVQLVAEVLGVQPVTDPTAEADMVTVDIGPIRNTAAITLLSWTPTPLRQTVKEVVEWYKDSGNRRYTTAFDESSSSSSSSSDSNSGDESAGAARERKEGRKGEGGREREGEEGNSAEPKETSGHEGGGRIGKRAWTEEGRDFKFDFQYYRKNY